MPKFNHTKDSAEDKGKEKQPITYYQRCCEEYEVKPPPLFDSVEEHDYYYEKFVEPRLPTAE